MATTRTPASNEQRPAEAPPITRSSRLSCIALAGGIAACGPPQRLAPATPSATEPQTEGQPPPSSETLVAPPVTPPGVRAKLVGQQGATRTYQLVLTPGTEVVAAISDFVLQNHIEAASFHGLGACTDAVLAYYDPLTHAYQKTAYKQQMEIVSLIGDAAPTAGDGAGIHAHMGVAFADGTMHGGHLFEAHVSPTLELDLTASPVAVHRAFDETFKGWLLVP
jgi:predicted DNA-binding protein with PD1-like motif